MIKSTSSDNSQGANKTMRTNRPSSNVSVASVSSYATVKASNRDIKGIRKKVRRSTNDRKERISKGWTGQDGIWVWKACIDPTVGGEITISWF